MSDSRPLGRSPTHESPDLAANDDRGGPVSTPSPGDAAHYAALLVDSVPALLAYWDAGLRCRFANRAYERWFGRGGGEMVGMAMQDVWPASLFALNEPQVRAALAGEVQAFERLAPRAHGAPCHVHATYLPDVVDGVVRGFMVQAVETTPMKQAETALRYAQQLGRIGSWEWDALNDRTTWSAEMYRILGLEPGSAPPPFADRAKYYLPESFQALQAAVARARSHAEPYQLELQYLRPDGSIGWLEARGAAVRDAAGAVVRLYGTAQEITERKLLNEARLQRDVAEATDREKTLMLSRASHELRTPMNGVLGYAQLLQRDPALDRRQRRWADQIADSGRQMLGLVDKLLQLSGAVHDEAALRCVECDLGEAVHAALADQRADAQRAGVRTAVLLPEALPLRVMGDPDGLVQVFVHLLSNAIKYSAPGTSVSLFASHLGEHVVLTVEDHGIGMSPQQMARLFMPFERLGAENSAVQGAGMGLALAKDLVERMGGKLHVHSEPGVGSAFSVSLKACGGPPAA